MTKKQFKVLDLFAGCGGFSHGLEMTGEFKIVAANEIWKPAQDTYALNHPETILVRGDITETTTKELIFEIFAEDSCDVIIGGPPCQAYSNAGFRDPDDPRGKLFEDYVKIVEKLQPSVFVMENVKGILTMAHDKEELSGQEAAQLNVLRNLEKERHELLLLRKKHKNNPERFEFTDRDSVRLDECKGEISSLKKKQSSVREKVTSIICRRFESLGYKVSFQLLNAANYGVPQKRERVIFIGVREDVDINFPIPTHSPQKSPGLFEDKRWITVREAIDDLSELPEDHQFNHSFTKHSQEFVEKIRRTEIGKSVFGGFSDAFYRNCPDEPARTVKENHGGVFVHYDQNRVMTPRELARLQSFPDTFAFSGSKSQVLVQIGNAVPPLLGRAVGHSISSMMREITSLKKATKVSRSK